jgi:hypothetical protein
MMFSHAEGAIEYKKDQRLDGVDIDIDPSSTSRQQCLDHMIMSTRNSSNVMQTVVFYLTDLPSTLTSSRRPMAFTLRPHLGND